MHTQLTVPVLLLIVFFTGVRCLAQDHAIKPVAVEIHKKDGSLIRGKSLGVQKDTLLFKDDNGEIHKISMREVQHIEQVDSMRVEKKWFPHPNTLRYLLSSSAIPLDKNQLMLGTTYGFIGTFHYGLTDRVSIGGGTSLFRAVSFLNAKVNILRRPKHKISTGIHYYRLPKDFIESFSGDDYRDLMLLSVSSTWGNENNHFTLGAQYMYIFKGFIPPTITVGGTVRALQRLAFVTENWFFVIGEQINVPVVISIGARYLGKNTAIDLGFYSDHQSKFGSVVPYIAYSYNLGRFSNE